MFNQKEIMAPQLLFIPFKEHVWPSRGGRAVEKSDIPFGKCLVNWNEIDSSQFFRLMRLVNLEFTRDKVHQKFSCKNFLSVGVDVMLFVE